MPRQVRTDDTLRGMSEHIHYEWTMLQGTAVALSAGGIGDQCVLNALIESFVIHLRGLMDFLYAPSNAQADDVIALDFFDDPAVWLRLAPPPMSPTLLDAKKRAGKEVAHLTYARLGLAPVDKEWQFAALAHEIDALMGLFKKHAPSGRLASCWS